MERDLGPNSDLGRQVQLTPGSSDHVLITEEALQGLKRLARDGCLLCELEHLDEEDWD